MVVESVAKGGSRLHQVIDQLKRFKSTNGDDIVDKICISVGTNDIRYCIHVWHLRAKFKYLCSLIEELYPTSKVFFQLLIPLPCINKNDWHTNSNVLDFNRLITNECVFRRFHILDAFGVFCTPYRDLSSPELRNPRLFVGSNIHPSESKGMGILAKLYLRALHSKYFDPFTFQ